MSVNIGGKPIVTDRLTGVWDPISAISYPSGSEILYNHFSEAHVKKVSNGYATNHTGFYKSGFATYGAETAHQKQKGYLISDGSDDYLAWGNASDVYLNPPITGGIVGGNYASAVSFGGWFLLDPSNSSTRYLYGMGSTYSGYGLSHIYVNNSGTTLSFKHLPYQSNWVVNANNLTLEDNKWHYIMCVVEGTSVNNGTITIYVDGGLGGSGTMSISSSNFRAFFSYSGYSQYYTVGASKTSTSSYLTSWLGGIGPHHIYHKALSQEECRQNYYAGIERFNFTIY